MRCIRNQNGVALITALMFTAISLVLCLALLYIVTVGIQTSGALKGYKTALDATYGGTDIMVKDLVNTSFGYKDYLTLHVGATFPDYLKSNMGLLAANATVGDCMNQRLTLPRTQWSASCKDTSLDPKTGHTDVSFELNAASGTPYKVYTKIVDTMERKFLVLDGGTEKTVVMAGNSDTSTLSLEGGSTTEGGQVTVPHYPYVYRIEIQGERKQNPKEKANVSVLYAY
ncbi:MAG: hypothetical protein WCA04_11640 [Geobacteraceae bacterium]